METNANRLFKEQNERLVRATFKKGVIAKVYLSSFSADVFIIGNTQTLIKNVPFASNVSIAGISIGDKCRLDLFDETNPNDMVISYTYGRPNKSTGVQFTTGINSISTSGSIIPHGLGVTPDVVLWSYQDDAATTRSTSASLPVSGGAGGTAIGTIADKTTVPIWETTPADNINIYLQSDNGGGVSVKWYAIKF